jgi:ceramide glucosyltransferase
MLRRPHRFATASGHHPWAAKEDRIMRAIFWVMAATSSLILLLSQWLAQRKRHRVETAGTLMPPISVLRPVKGLDEGMYENLVALARQDYPQFEIVICAEDPGDPALECARRLQAEFPEVRIVVCAGSAQGGLNPKVRLLDAMARQARFDTLLISDSNVRPGPDYLARIACAIPDGENAMVSCLVAGIAEHSPGAAMENLHLNAYIAPSVALADAAGCACVIGKSMLFRRSDLMRLGGFDPVRDVLAEDYLLGRTFQRAGGSVVLAPEVAPVFNQRRTIRDFLGRHLRWCQMRFLVSPLTFVLEPLLNPTPMWLALAGAGSPALGAAGVAAKAVMDLVTSKRLSGRWPSAWSLFLVPVKDLLMLAVWAAAFFHRRICWRGNELLMSWGSRLSPRAAQGAGAAVEGVVSEASFGSDAKVNEEPA